ncbi:MAG TPA: DUF6263 family protein [Ignavibacteriales bacterium]|nr:DUF6263 family protein [Ignavibacteriales bacterium]
MKNIFLLLLISLFVFGCGKKEENKPAAAQSDTSSVLKTVPDDAPPKDVDLVYTLKKDQHLSYKLTSTSSQVQSVVADSTLKQSAQQTVSYIVDMDVRDVDNDNTMDIKATIKWAKLDQEANGQKLNYESGKLKDPKEIARFVDYEAVLDNPFNFRMNSKGEILEIYHVDKIVDKYLEIQGLKDSVNAAQKSQFQSNISEGALKPLIQQIFRTLPKNRVAKDSTWHFDYPSRMGVFDIQNIAQYKLVNFEKMQDNDNKLAVIDAGLKIIPKGKNKVSDRGIDYDFKNPEAQGSGTIYFNLTKGCVQNSKTSTKMKMSVTVKSQRGPKGPMKAVRNDDMETTNTLQLIGS